MKTKTIALAALLVSRGFAPRAIAGLAIVLCYAAGTMTLASADPVRIRIGWAQVPTQITPLVAALAKTRPELFPNLNRTYTYEPQRFQGSPPQITAFASGEIEVAAFGPSALALSVTTRISIRASSPTSRRTATATAFTRPGGRCGKTARSRRSTT